MDKRIAQFLGLCQRAGKLSSGETGALSAIKDGSAELVIVAENASDNTKKRFSDSTRFYNKKMIFVQYTQDLYRKTFEYAQK